MLTISEKEIQILGYGTGYTRGLVLLSFKNTVGRIYFWLEINFNNSSSHRIMTVTEEGQFTKNTSTIYLNYERYLPNDLTLKIVFMDFHKKIGILSD